MYSTCIFNLRIALNIWHQKMRGHETMGEFIVGWLHMWSCLSVSAHLTLWSWLIYHPTYHTCHPCVHVPNLDLRFRRIFRLQISLAKYKYIISPRCQGVIYSLSQLHFLNFTLFFVNNHPPHISHLASLTYRKVNKLPINLSLVGSI